MKDFFELTDQELLALGIPLEEEGARTYGDIPQELKSFLQRKTLWLRRPLVLDKKRFCERAWRRSTGLSSAPAASRPR